MAAAKWEGVFPAVTTKFKPNEDLDGITIELTDQIATVSGSGVSTEVIAA